MMAFLKWPCQIFIAVNTGPACLIWCVVCDPAVAVRSHKTSCEIGCDEMKDQTAHAGGYSVC